MNKSKLISIKNFNCWKQVADSFDDIVEILSNGVLNGDLQIEQMRCIFVKNDSDIIYLLNALDFIDLDPSKDSIKKITLYQLIDQKSIS